MNVKTLTKMLNTLPKFNFEGYSQSVYVYGSDATTLYYHIWWKNTDEGVQIKSDRKGRTAIITGWLDALGLDYTIEVDTYRRCKLVHVTA